jgi:VWFA-related protein
VSSIPGFNENQKIQPERHEVTVRLVLVDVIATDKEGKVVTGLTEEDFEILEDGKIVPINSVDFINFESPSIESAEKMKAPARKKRFFVIFDSINTIRRMLDRSKARILDKLIELIRSGGEIMVMEMSEEGGIQILQPFSSDPQLIAQAIEKASGSIWVEKATDDLAIPDVLLRKEVSPRGEPIFDPEHMKQSIKEMYQYQTRIRFEKTLSSLLSVMNMIKDYPGRKPVLLVSGGFPALSLDKFAMERGIESKIGHSDIAAAKIVDPFKVLQKGGRRYGDDIFNNLIEFANSSNITFYTLDPDSYLRYVLPDMTFDSFERIMDVAMIKQNELNNLKYMAFDTGGVTLQGANKFDEFQKVLNRDLFSFYELSYYPERKKSDGKYHKIQVKVKKPGVNIRFRKGYYDYNPDQEESLLFASTAANPGLFKQIDFQARIVPFVSTRDKCILWINMALPVKDLILSSDPNKEFKVIKASLWMDDPEDQDAFNARLDIPISLTPSFGQKLEKARYFGHNICSEEIRLDKDRYRFIFALFDQESGRVGTVVQAFETPILKEGSESEIANVVFGLLRESREGGKPFTLSQKDGTLYVDQNKFYPMGSNQFSGKVTVSVFMQVLTPHINAEFKPEIIATQNDQILGQVPLKLVKQYRNKKAQAINMVCNLDFSQFLKGSYVLQIRLYDSSLNQEVTEKVQIQII